MVRYYMHRPLAVDVRFSVRSYLYFLDDDGVDVGDDGYIGVNDGFYEYDVSTGVSAGEDSSNEVDSAGKEDGAF